MPTPPGAQPPRRTSQLDPYARFPARRPRGHAAAVELDARSEIRVEKIAMPVDVRKGQPLETRVVITNDSNEGKPVADQQFRTAVNTVVNGSPFYVAPETLMDYAKSWVCPPESSRTVCRSQTLSKRLRSLSITGSRGSTRVGVTPKYTRRVARIADAQTFWSRRGGARRACEGECVS